MDDYVIRASSPLGYSVYCSKETWYNHITSKEGHPIMLGNKEKVKSAIDEPESIFVSNQTSKKHVYFKKSIYETYGKKKIMYTKVVVENNINYSEVKSAWPQSEISGGIGDVIYVKPKL